MFALPSIYEKMLLLGPSSAVSSSFCFKFTPESKESSKPLLFLADFDSF